MSVYIPPSVRTARDDTGATAVVSGGEIIPAIIGRTNGASVTKNNVVIPRVAAGTNDVLPDNPVDAVLAVRSLPNGGIPYVAGTDYNFTAPNTIAWLNTVLLPPFLFPITVTPNGGALTAGPHSYVITATRVTDNGVAPTFTRVSGETVASNEITVTNAAGDANSLNWPSVPGASGYRVFRSGTPGVYADTLIATLTGENTTTFVDTGLATAVGTPPVANGALKRPATNSSYYVTYKVTVKTYFTPRIYTRLASVIADHGLGSDIVIAATVMMGTAGKGNNATQVVGIAIPDTTLPSFQAAFDILSKRKDVTIRVPCSSDLGVAKALKASIQNDASIDNMNETIGIVGPPVGMPIGDPLIVGTAINELLALADERMVFVYPWFRLTVQGANGTFTDTTMDGWVTAAALAGLIASLPDRAEPATGKQILGLKSFGVDLDSTQQNMLASYGATIIEEDVGNFVVRDSVTTRTDVEELKHPSIILTDDWLRKNLRANIKQYKGRKLLPKLLNLVEQKTKDVLGKAKKFNLIADFDPETITAEQDTAIATRIIILFKYAAIYPARIFEFRYAWDTRPSF
jgi:hypothetical protein